MTIFTVNTSDDGSDGSCDAQHCSLREAIIALNADTGTTSDGDNTERIHFAIGSGAASIEPVTALPTITDGGVLDAESQPGFAGTPLVEISGRSNTDWANGLDVNASRVTIRGFVISGFAATQRAGIHFSGSGTVTGNWIGVTADGAAAAPNDIGIFVSSGGVRIGGTLEAHRNVVSGNVNAGIRIGNHPDGAAGNEIDGNYIGTDPTGTFAVVRGDGGRQYHGIEVQNAGETWIGVRKGNLISGNRAGIGVAASMATVIVQNRIGTDASGLTAVPNTETGVVANSGWTTIGDNNGRGNVVSGNGAHGIYLGPSATNSVVQGNLVGTDATGEAALANAAFGIFAEADGAEIGVVGAGNVVSGNGQAGIYVQAAQDVVVRANHVGTSQSDSVAVPNGAYGIGILWNAMGTIGGWLPEEENRVKHNAGAGIIVHETTYVQIAPNSIAGNGGLGIDLGSDGVDQNDFLDEDTGANDKANFPVIDAATEDGIVTGSYHGLPSEHVDIRLYGSASCDESGYGEGDVFLGALTISTDEHGNATWAGQVPSLAVGTVVTAAASVWGVNSSEFSGCAVVTDASVSPAPTDGDGSPSPSYSPDASYSPEPTPEATSTSEPTMTPEPTPEATATSEPTMTPEPTPEATATSEPTMTPEPPQDESVSTASATQLSTDTEGDGATASDQIETTVTTPSEGTISISEGSTTQTAPTGYSFAGYEVQVETDVVGTVDAPIYIQFLLDSSLGVQEPVTVFRDGVAVDPCDPAETTTASPDPCMTTEIVGDDLVITVRTTHASIWNFGSELGTGSVAGVVYSPTGDPYGGARLVACQGSCAETQSASDGTFNIPDLSVGYWQLTAYSVNDEYPAVITSVEVLESTTASVDIHLVLGPPGSIAGTITTSNGAEPGALTVEACNENVECWYTTSAVDGTYRISHLAAGGYWLNVFPPSDEYSHFGTSVVVADGEVVVNVVLEARPTGAIEGYVTNNGAAVPHAAVELCKDFGCGGEYADENGFYRVNYLSAGTYQVGVYNEQTRERTTAIVEVADGTVRQDIAMTGDPLPGAIAGVVRDESGQPLAPQFDEYGDPITSPSVSVCRDDRLLCEATALGVDGAYRAGYLTAGTYYVEVSAPDRPHVDVFGPVTVADAEVVYDVQLLAPPTGAITGAIVDAAGNPAGASVQACSTTSCYWSSTDETGRYSIPSLPAAEYQVMAQPWDSFQTAPDPVSVTVAEVSVEAPVLQLGSATPPPDGTSIETSSGDPAPTTDDGYPMLSMSEPFVLRTEGCAGGSATYTITGDGATLSGELVETSTGVYEAQFELTFAGLAEISIALTCPGATTAETAFNVYIDPSGWVYNTKREPLVGATVVLLRSDSPDGPFTAPPNGSLIMSPSNRTNPDLTDSTGHFGWDVIPGYYKVRAHKDGCEAPDGSARYVETIVYAVPPPVFDIDLRLWCGEERPTDTTAPTLECTPATFELRQSGAAVEASVSDAGSGPLDALVSAAADTSSVGRKSVTLTGSDRAGNTATETCGYQVVYDFRGFAAPVDNDMLNSAKAGQPIPLKWRVLDAADAPVTDLGSAALTVATLACETGTSPDALEEYAAGSSGLQNLGDGYYQINWKTPTSYAKSCKTLRLDLGEGAGGDPTYHTADFKFVK